MASVKCGILFNGKQNSFLEYLDWIINSQDSYDFEISFVHTNAEDKVSSRDVRIGDYKSVIENSDVVFSLGYWKKIPKEDIEKVSLGIVNFHHSYRLKFQGRHCATWALVHGEKIHGSTMHFIDEKIDEGDIIDTDYFHIGEEDVAEDVFLKANSIGLDLLAKNFLKVIKGNFEKSTEYSDQQYSYRARDLRHEVHLSLDENLFLRNIRALTFSNMPSPFVVLDGQKVFLKMEKYDDGILRKQ